jgi:hypothetical protein
MYGMNAKALAAIIAVSLFLLSGCLEEDFQQAKEKAIEFAESNPEFASFLQRNPNAETTAQRIEREQSGLFEDHPILDKARQQCGKEFAESAYWYVKAKQGKGEISILIDSRSTTVECLMGGIRCSSDSECYSQDSCIEGKCDFSTNACIYGRIGVCSDNDGCCLSGCSKENDTDCLPPAPDSGDSVIGPPPFPD